MELFRGTQAEYPLRTSGGPLSAARINRSEFKTNDYLEERGERGDNRIVIVLK